MKFIPTFVTALNLLQLLQVEDPVIIAKIVIFSGFTNLELTF